MRNRKFKSPNDTGFEEIITRKNSEMEVTEFYRLNLQAGGEYQLVKDDMEIGIAVISGKWDIKIEGKNYTCKKFDTVYKPAGERVFFKSLNDGGIIYMGAAPSFEKKLASYKTPFDKDLPIGDRHQIHGEGVYQRKIFMGIGPQDDAYRLIMGFTWGNEGQWTSWPPHEHAKYLEEIYAFFEIDYPDIGFQLLFEKFENTEDVSVIPVRSGDAVAIPREYHSCVAAPGVRCQYLWIMSARDPKTDRRYDLAENHPAYKNEGETMNVSTE